jgi:hypothetical protein
MKQGDEALHASSLHCYNFYALFNALVQLIFKENHRLTLHHHHFFIDSSLMLHRCYFSKKLCPPLLGLEVFCRLGLPEVGEMLFSPPLYRQRYQAVLTYLDDEQQNIGTIQVTPLSPPAVPCVIFGLPSFKIELWAFYYLLIKNSLLCSLH